MRSYNTQIITAQLEDKANKKGNENNIYNGVCKGQTENKKVYNHTKLKHQDKHKAKYNEAEIRSNNGS